jgi:hypothetical protein
MAKTKYVEVDGNTGQISIILPTDLESHYSDLNHDFMEQYAYEELNRDTIANMNDFIINWFKDKGIVLTFEDDAGK